MISSAPSVVSEEVHGVVSSLLSEEEKSSKFAG
jgi:hypothetical protein